MITIPATHNGPDGRGHGGTAAGRFAELVDSTAASVRLHAPVPLDVPLRSLSSATHARVFDADTHVASVTPLTAPLPVGHFGRLRSVDVSEAEAAWLEPRDGAHMAPRCFACGHERSAGTGGLGLRPGPVAETGLFATAWSPCIEGDVPPELIWAALDCPTGFPALARLDHDHIAVTGELAVEIRDTVRGDGDLQLLGRVVEVVGRRLITEGALVDERGGTLAVARATWVAIPVASVAASLRPAA